MASAPNGSSDKNDGDEDRRITEQIYCPSTSSTRLEDIIEIVDFVNEDDAKDLTKANVQLIRFVQSRFEQYGNLMTSAGPSNKQLEKATPLLVEHHSHNRIPSIQPPKRKESLTTRNEKYPFAPCGARNSYPSLQMIPFVQTAPYSVLKKFQNHKSVQTEPMVEKEYHPWLIRAKNSADRLCLDLTNYINSLIHSVKKTEKITDLEAEAVVGESATQSGKSLSKKKPLLYDGLTKHEFEISKKLNSILDSAKRLRNSIPIPLNYEDETSLGLESDEENNEKVVETEESDENTKKSEKTISISSTRTNLTEETVLKNTGAIPKKRNKSFNTKEGTIQVAPRVPNKPPRKSNVSLPPESKPPRKSNVSLPPESKPPCKFKSLPVTRTPSSKTKVSVESETKPPRKSVGSLPVVSKSSSERNKSKTLDRYKPQMPVTRSQIKLQTKPKDEPPNTRTSSIREKQTPRTDTKKAVASNTDKPSSSNVKAKSEDATETQELKPRPARILKRRDNVISKSNRKLRERANEKEWR